MIVNVLGVDDWIFLIIFVLVVYGFGFTTLWYLGTDPYKPLFRDRRVYRLLFLFACVFIVCLVLFLVDFYGVEEVFRIKHG